MNKQTLEACHGDPMAFFQLAFQAMGREMAPFQQERFEALAPSLLAVAKGERPARQKFLIDTVKGTSKTSDLALMVLWLLAFARVHRLVQCGAADFDQASEIKKAIAAWLRLMPWLAERVTVKNWNATSAKVTVEILPADEFGSHGSRPDVLIIDELAHITKWGFVEVLADNASKVPHVLVVISTNAGFINTPAWEWRELARTSDRWTYLQRCEPAPWVDPDEIAEAAIRNSPQRFARLWQGVWSSGTGDHIDMDDVRGCITARGPVIDPDEAREYHACAGLDLGVRNDHSALVVLGVKPGVPRIRLLDFQWWEPSKGRDVDLIAVKQACIRAAQRYNLHGLHYDPSQCQLLVQQLRRERGIICQEMGFVGSNLDAMARTLMEVFKNRSIELYKGCERLVEDLGRIVIEEKPFGQKITAVSNSRGHCDVGIALSIALVPAVHLLNSFGGGAGSPPESRRVEPFWSGKHGVQLHRPIGSRYFPFEGGRR